MRQDRRHARWKSSPRRVGPLAAVLAGLAVVIAGCGPQGPVRYRVQGSVTYDGKPVPVGRIIFNPDMTKGNRGPQGFAVIENGRFDTARNHGKGTSGGPMVVTIDAFEPSGAGTRPLVSGHQESRDFPMAAAELTFDVPAQKAR